MFIDSIVAIATASGRGSVGIIRISGKDLKDFIFYFFGQSLIDRKATYLPFKNAENQILDFGIAIYFKSPNSFTGEDVLELQAHGGSVSLNLLLKSCLEIAKNNDLNLRLSEPGEFTKRAFLNNKIDLTQAEAIADLINANTETAVKSANLSLSGLFAKEINELKSQIIKLRILIESNLDFPEEEIEFLNKENKKNINYQINKLENKLKEILNKSQQGLILREGIKVVIAGQTNVGKSSLLNHLAGQDLAIVSDIEGTTRDKVQEIIQIEGIPIYIIDTAGLRETIDKIENIGINKTWESVKSADLILFLHDLSRKNNQDYKNNDKKIKENLNKIFKENPKLEQNIINVWNKIDLLNNEKYNFYLNKKDKKNEIFISVKNDLGIENLKQKLLEIIGWQNNNEGIYLARERHILALNEVKQNLQNIKELIIDLSNLEIVAEELRLAQNNLNKITGEFSSDDLLGEIFSSFCIGK